MCIPWLYIYRVLMSFPEMWYGSVCQDGVHPRPAVVFKRFSSCEIPELNESTNGGFKRWETDGKMWGNLPINGGFYRWESDGKIIYESRMFSCHAWLPEGEKNKTKWPVFSCKTDEQRWDFRVPDFSDKSKYAPFQPDTCCLAPKPTAIIVIVKAPLWTGCVFNLRQSGLVDTPSCNVHHFFVDSDDTPGIT